jgi:glycosyltransferase involved in cell wall biosynthesis
MSRENSKGSFATDDPAAEMSRSGVATILENRPGKTQCSPGNVVSFIVPALNEELHIGRCLQSIRKLTLPAEVEATEIIVVDNQSTDQTAEVSRRLDARVIDVAPGRPSVARNAGARTARGNWLAFVDADCELPADWLSRCASELARGEAIVAVGGAAAQPDDSASWVTRAWHGLAHKSPGSKARHVRWLPTFNLLVRRDAFDRAGRFDESLSTCEDCALGFNLSSLGNLVHDPLTQVVHLGESRSLGEVFFREAWRATGNLRLAASRPFDVQNWLSLLVPPSLVLGFLASMVALAASEVSNWPLWPPLAVMAIVIVCTLLLVLRKATSWKPHRLLQQLIVYATYLAGRTCGLFWSFRRVERN